MNGGNTKPNPCDPNLGLTPANQQPPLRCTFSVKVMDMLSERILGRVQTYSHCEWPLHDAAHTRLLEGLPGTHPADMPLMETAGLALARLTLALAPHASVVWIASGPGNNGGDGMVAARYLHQWGKQAILTLLHDPAHSPHAARQAWQAARSAGLRMQQEPPPTWDVCIDALFGIGTQRPITANYADWVERMNTSAAPTIAADIASGLDADTGVAAAVHVQADYTLSLLTLKPGLFTASGRDASGEIWFNDLDLQHTLPPQARLTALPARTLRTHASHKGSYGDVAIVGGASGMSGAVLLAGRSALQGGAGRVFVCPLDANAAALDNTRPELMFRTPDSLDFSRMAVVAGCGGGSSIASHLPVLLQSAGRLVLDADALNHLAKDAGLAAALARRSAGSSVITPHPLEAARLLGISVSEVQKNRLQAAQLLADRHLCTVALKGSGTIIAAPHEAPFINPTGNAKLASAGTGDVLAGLVGAYLAQGHGAFEAACTAVFRHGLAADQWQGSVLNASELCLCI